MRKKLTIGVIAVFVTLSVVCGMVFDFSSDVTQSEMKNVLEPFLEAVKLRLYRILAAGNLLAVTMQGMFKLPSRSRLNVGEDFIIWNDFAKAVVVKLRK